MSEYVRVRDQSTGHEYTIRTHLLVDGLEVLDKPALGRDRLPRLPKYRTPLGERPVKKPAKKAAPPVPNADPAPETSDGQSAGSEQEH